MITTLCPWYKNRTIMLNLFKLPFFGRDGGRSDQFPAEDVSFSIFRNLLSRSGRRDKNNCQEKMNHIHTELRSLEDRLKEMPKADRYDLIQETLRKIDEEIGR